MEKKEKIYLVNVKHVFKTGTDRYPDYDSEWEETFTDEEGINILKEIKENSEIDEKFMIIESIDTKNRMTFTHYFKKYVHLVVFKTIANNFLCFEQKGESPFYKQIVDKKIVEKCLDYYFDRI